MNEYRGCDRCGAIECYSWRAMTFDVPAPSVFKVEDGATLRVYVLLCATCASEVLKDRGDDEQ